MSDVSRLSDPSHDAWDWQSRGACRGSDLAVFFHPEFERGENRARRTAQAKALCAACPVIARCRDHALTVQEPYGTWGGLDELERREMIKKLRRTGAAPLVA